jgi:hypothetical protein
VRKVTHPLWNPSFSRFLFISFLPHCSLLLIVAKIIRKKKEKGVFMNLLSFALKVDFVCKVIKKVILQSKIYFGSN